MAERVKTEKEDEFFLFELMHGFYLVGVLLEKAGDSGESWEAEDDFEGRVGVFDKYPKLKEAYEKAGEAVAELYQVAGAHQYEEDDVGT